MQQVLKDQPCGPGSRFQFAKECLRRGTVVCRLEPHTASEAFPTIGIVWQPVGLQVEKQLQAMFRPAQEPVGIVKHAVFLVGKATCPLEGGQGDQCGPLP